MEGERHSEEQAKLFEVAKSNPGWLFGYVAATLEPFLRNAACEIKALQIARAIFDPG